MGSWAEIAAKTNAKLVRAQQYQKKHADARRRDINFEVGNRVFLSTRNLKLDGAKHLRDRYCGPFCITEKIGQAAYRLHLTGTGLQGIHDVFHVSLLKPYQNNGFAVDVPPVELEGEQEYEISCIKGHRVSRGEQ